MRSPGAADRDDASRIASSARSTFDGAGPRRCSSDNVELGREHPAAEALGAHRRRRRQRRAPEHEVAQDLAGRRALQETVAGEPGRVQEARDRLASPIIAL